MLGEAGRKRGYGRIIARRVEAARGVHAGGAHRVVIVKVLAGRAIDLIPWWLSGGIVHEAARRTGNAGGVSEASVISSEVCTGAGALRALLRPARAVPPSGGGAHS